MEWNAETVLDALNDFERKPDITPVLDEYLQRVAKNGEIVFPWSKLKPLLKKKLEVVLDDFYETCPVETSVPVPNFETFNFDNLKKSILQAVDTFTSAPFTIQRLCELVINPQKHYNRTDKYMRGIEKNVLVVSTIEPRSGAQGDNNSNNNNVIVNGMINDTPPREENDALNGHESESSDSVSSSNVENPSNHVLLENFANVFPSAACIPSASNICVKEEIDSDFVSTSSSECPEEADFERTSTTEEHSSEDDKQEVKDEPMDTTEEEYKPDDVSKPSDQIKTCAEDKTTEKLESAETETDEAPLKKIKLDTTQSSDDIVTDQEDLKETDVDPPQSEVETSKMEESVPISPEELSETSEEVEDVKDQCQQDDTVSQSDSVNDDSVNDDSVNDDSVNDDSVDDDIANDDIANDDIANDDIVNDDSVNVDSVNVDSVIESSITSETISETVIDLPITENNPVIENESEQSNPDL